MKKRLICAAMAAVMVCGLLTGCGGKKESADSKGTIVIGSDNMVENQIASEIYTIALEEAGYTVEREEQLDVAHDALVGGDIDMWCTYTGTIYTRFMENDPIYDPDEMLKTIQDYYSSEKGIKILNPSTLNNTYGIAMLKDRAEELGIKTYADLQKKADQVVWGDWGFLAMPTTGRVRIEELYGPFNFKDVQDIAFNLSYDILRSGDVDVIPVCTTDAQLAEDDILQLDAEDPNVWPQYLLVPMIRQEILDANPEVEQILNDVTAKISIDSILPLIVKVSIDNEDPRDVAEEFYKANF